jgi:hypothetical protein
MAAKTILKTIKLELPKRLRRKTRTPKSEEVKVETMCQNCSCTDLEDWFSCQYKK